MLVNQSMKQSTNYSRSVSSKDTSLQDLQGLLGERLSFSELLSEQHGHDESFHSSAPPEAVAFVESNEEVAEVVRICVQYKKPVILFGTETSLEGQFAALKGGIYLDLSRMNQMLEVNENDMDCRVQPGVKR